MSIFDRQLAKDGRDTTLQSRTEKITNGQSSQVFNDLCTVRALIKTVRGKSVFDSTGTQRVATHEICLYFVEGITSETWVKLDTRRIKVLTVENICEGDKRLRLMCTERGEDSKVVNQA